MHGEILTYGLKSGTKHTIVKIDDAQNGLKCDCVCPHCKERLIARNEGKKKVHHFAHISGVDCVGARMSALHLLVQNVLAEEKKIMLPAYNGRYVRKESQLRVFDEIVLEETCENEGSTRRPDCIGYNKGKEQSLWIEIYCRHKIDDEKRKDIISRKQYCIEVDFSDLLKTEYTEKDVIERLVTDDLHREWICCPVWDEKDECERLKEKKKKRERQRLEKEERQRELDQRKKEHERYEYLTRLADKWRENPNQSVVDAIKEEIRKNPYDKDGICRYLVPSSWGEEYSRFPRNDFGIQVFNYLVHYYYHKIKLNDTWSKGFSSSMWDLIKKEERTREDDVLLEYMVVIWVLNLLNKHNSNLDKTFSVNSNIRQSIIKIMVRSSDQDKLLQENIRNKIRQYYLGKKDGFLIWKVFEVCFPIIARKSIEQNQQEFSKNKKTRERNSLKSAEVVMAIIFDEQGRIFARQREYNGWKDWGVLGGEIEKGETLQDALRRKVREELAAEIEVVEAWRTIDYDYPNWHLKMHCFKCRLAGGGMTLLEHKAARWLRLEELETVKWLPADEAVIKELK